MEESVNQRIKTVLRKKSLSITAFCKELSLPQTTINKQINGDSKLSFDTIKSFLTRFPDISADWLITGVGDMYGNGQQHHNVYVNSDGAHLVQVANGDNNNQEISPEELKQENDALKRENEALKKDIGNLEQRIAEKDEEIKFLRSLLAK